MSSAIIISDPTSHQQALHAFTNEVLEIFDEDIAAFLYLLLEVNRLCGDGICQKQNQIQNAYIFQGYINKLKQSVYQVTNDHSKVLKVSYRLHS